MVVWFVTTIKEGEPINIDMLSITRNSRRKSREVLEGAIRTGGFLVVLAGWANGNFKSSSVNRMSQLRERARDSWWVMNAVGFRMLFSMSSMKAAMLEDAKKPYQVGLRDTLPDLVVIPYPTSRKAF